MSLPHVVIQHVMQDLIRELSQPREKFCSHTWHFSKGSVLGKDGYAPLLRSRRLSLPSSSVRQLRGNKTPPETLAGGGGAHQLRGGAAEIAPAMHVMKVTCMRAIIGDPGNRDNWKESTEE